MDIKICQQKRDFFGIDQLDTKSPEGIFKNSKSPVGIGSSGPCSEVCRQSSHWHRFSALGAKLGSYLLCVGEDSIIFFIRSLYDIVELKIPSLVFYKYRKEKLNLTKHS